MMFLESDDDLPEEPIIITEEETDAMIDDYMSRPKTSDEEAFEDRFVENWFPKAKNHKSLRDGKCNGRCFSCAPTTCPAFN